MKVSTYQQAREFSRETFILENDRLIIVEKSMGLSKERVFRIDEISDIELGSRRFSRFYVVPLIFGTIATAMTWQIINHDAIPSIIAIFPATFIPVSLWHIVRGFKPIEVSRFRSEDGALLFEIYRPRGSALIYEEFVSSLRTHLVDCENQSKHATS